MRLPLVLLLATLLLLPTALADGGPPKLGQRIGSGGPVPFCVTIGDDDGVPFVHADLDRSCTESPPPSD